MKKKKIDKGTALYAGVIGILIGIFVGIFVYGLNKVLAMEGQMPPHDVTEGITSAPETCGEGVDYLNDVIATAIEYKPLMSRSDSFSVGDVNVEDDEKLTKFADYIADDFESKLEDGFEGIERNYGEGFEDIIMMPNLESTDIVMYNYYQCSQCGRTQESESDTCDDCGGENTLEAKDAQVYCNYMYYECPSCGETSNIPLDCCEPCGSTQPYYLCYKDDYEITLMVRETALEKTFAPLSKDEAKALLGDELDDVLDIIDFSIDYDGLRVYFKVNREYDKLQYLEYRKDMTVTAQVKFKGEYAEEGEKTITFTLTEKNKFDFTWPSLELDEHEMVIEPKGTDNLLATLTCDEPTKYTVRWKSSDENVVTVDDEGYLKAGKNAGDATITAEFDFGDETFVDYCTVHVRIPVEGLTLNKRKVTLSVGETFRLNAETDPKDATITSVKWYSEDEDEAVVKLEANGLITAVGSGTATIYALSDDGYYKSSCEVTVK